MKKKVLQRICSLLMVVSMILGIVGCAKTPEPTPNNDNPGNTDKPVVQEVEIADIFVESQMEFSVDLFKEVVKNGENENLMISPLSVSTALAILAEGSDTKTKEELESTLSGYLSLEELTDFLSSYLKNLPTGEKCKFVYANAIWANEKDGLKINEDFLKFASDTYGADIKKGPFTNKTVWEINKWVYKNTDGMIDKILKELPPDAVMCILNAVAFDAEWKDRYEKDDIEKKTFTSYSGKEQKIDFMNSREEYLFEDEYAAGFKKKYKGGNYSFVALLPYEGVDVNDYVSQLTPRGIKEMLDNYTYADVHASIPKFESEYEVEMNDILKGLNLNHMFDKKEADFSKLGVSDGKNIYVHEVKHKTYILVDEVGTKASAVTSVIMNELATAAPSEPVEIILDRPFVYMIIDESTNLPVFMGVLYDVQ